MKLYRIFLLSWLHRLIGAQSLDEIVLLQSTTNATNNATNNTADSNSSDVLFGFVDQSVAAIPCCCWLTDPHFYNPRTDDTLPHKQFQIPLPIQAVLEPGDDGEIKIGARYAERQILSGFDKAKLFLFGDADEPMTSTKTYSYLGPTILVDRGRNVQIHWVNQIMYSDKKHRAHIFDVFQKIPWANPPGGMKGRDDQGDDSKPYDQAVPLVIHVIGQRNHDHSNGFPQAWCVPDVKDFPDDWAQDGTLYQTFRDSGPNDWDKGSSVYEYQNDDAPLISLYVENTFGASRYGTQAGLFGRYHVKDSSVPDLKAPVVDITIWDIRLGYDGQLVYPFNPYGCSAKCCPPKQYPPDFFGDVIVANGIAWPVYTVNERCYQLRIFNAAHARWFYLKFDNIKEFIIIGRGQGYIDGDKYPQGEKVDSVWLAPMQAVIIMVDFQGLQGNRVILLNHGPDGPMQEKKSTDQNHNKATGRVMAFDVVPFPGATPKNLRCFSSPDPVFKPAAHLADTKKELSVAIMTKDLDCPHGKYSSTYFVHATFKEADHLKPRTFNDRITEHMDPGKVYRWLVYNYAEWYDTFYVAGGMVEVIEIKDLDGKPLPICDDELGLQVMVVLPPKSVLTVKVLYKLEGLYHWGSTIAERKDYDDQGPVCIGDGVRACQVFERDIIPRAREDLCLIKTSSSDGDRCVTKDPVNNDATLDYCRGTDNQLWKKVDFTCPGFHLQNLALVNNHSACLAIYNGASPGQITKDVVLWECSDKDLYQTWRWEATLLTKGLVVSTAPTDVPLCLDWRMDQKPAGTFINVIVRKCQSTSTVWQVECGPECRYNEWLEWSSCSKECGGGQRKRTREAQLPGLAYCTGTVEIQPCNTWDCVVQEQCMIRPVYDPYHKKCLTFGSKKYLEVETCTGEDAQRWTFDGSVLKSMASVSGLEVCATVAPDLTVRVWACDNNKPKSQQWSQYFDAMVSVQEGLCLDITDGIDWTVDSQPVGLKACHGRDNQAWTFDCTAADICVNYCPGMCSCQLDNSNNPYCVCPGSSCASLTCFNGGLQYYDGSDCQCRCPVGFRGTQCTNPLACMYSPWSDWTPCTTLCGGGKKTRTRLPLQYPELCTDITDITSCNVQPCSPGPIPVPVPVPGGGGPVIGGGAVVGDTTGTGGTTVTVPPVLPAYLPIPYSGTQPIVPTGTRQCRLQLTTPTAQLCLSAKNEQQMMAEACTDVPQQQWQYDGKALRCNGKCLGVSGGAGTDLTVSTCSGATTQQFTIASYKVATTSGNCLQLDGNGNTVKAKPCASSAGQWAMACLNTTAGTTVVDTASGSGGCMLTLGTSGQCLLTNGTAVNIGPCTNTTIQQWAFSTQDKSVRVTAYPNKCLDIEGGLQGTKLTLSQCTSQPSQQFLYDGAKIVASDGRCVGPQSVISGQRVLLSQCTGSAQQLFTKKCSTPSQPGVITPPTPPTPSSTTNPPVCGDWGTWGSCSVSCGTGLQSRTRSQGCDQPLDTRPCKLAPCLPHDCSYGDWAPWSTCSNSCDGGFSTRFRGAIGGSVSLAGPCTSNAEIRLCNLVDCKS